MEREADRIFPFSWEDSEVVDEVSFVYYGVIFNESFGTFEKGREVQCLITDFDKGILYEIDEEGNFISETPFKCVSI